ncbi:MAG: tetratricopeptide repeat protein [candidate division Zixibacteria bacterium]|nr:tetratricopeptide repeat protein [candidate division Zixibacteria bacterium]MDH3937562.1 tetratricopeptide repeat protein [candidate division Zixibacteria bacterium]MDH4033712.1 tetratricopeptide repeat protein [candidate division Zixibacteria bacterium]
MTPLKNYSVEPDSPEGPESFLVRHRWLLIIAGLAFLARLVYLFELSLQPGFTAPMIDEKWHWEWAQGILSKSFWGEGAYFRAPLYPYLLAFLHFITGGSIFFSKLLQSILASGTSVFVCLIASRLFNRITGIVAGIAYALYGPLLFYETMFLIPALFLFLITWGMYRVVEFRHAMSVRNWLVTGLLFGVAALARPNILLVVPVLMGWLYFVRQSETAATARLKRPLVMLIGVLIAVLPVTVRNLIVTGDPILISSQGGINLHLGNNQVADGLTMIMPEVDLNESVSWREFGIVTKAAAQREAGRELSEAEQSSFWTAKALSFIANNPARFLDLVWRKSVYLVCGLENSDNLDIYYQRTKSHLLSVLLFKIDNWLYFPFGLLLPLAMVGVYVHRAKWRNLAPVYLFLLAYIPSIVLFLVTARHRLPLVPFLIILAAAGVVSLIKRSKPLRKKEWAAMLLIGLAAFFVNRTYYELSTGSLFQVHFNSGIQHEAVKDYVNAEKEYRLADQSYPYSPTLINNLGFVQYRLGMVDEARANFHRGLRLNPDHAPLYNNLGLLVSDEGFSDSALNLLRIALDKYDSSVTMPAELAQVWLNMADVHEEMVELDSAAEAYHRAMVTAPELGRAYYKGAAFYSRHGGHRISDSLYKEGQRYLELSSVEYFNWGLSYINRRRFTEGCSKMMMALKLNPDMHQAWYSIGYAYYQAGEPKDSVYQFLDRALKIDSAFQPAVNLRQVLEQRGF